MLLKEKSWVRTLITEIDLEIAVTEIIQKFGIPANIKGYRYLRHALMLCVKNSQMITSATKLLYPAVAAKYNTTPTLAASSINRAIGMVWDKGNEEMLCQYFGKTVLTRKKKPTNTEFIATVAEMVRIRIKMGKL